jgi:phosphopantetheinyl transferase (holo-ACP synthase)
LIGNDVIDLDLAAQESNTRRKGWLEKLFTKCEQKTINNAANQHQVIWLLWSMKESAYKAFVRETGITGFYPAKIKCDLQNSSVSIAGALFFTHSVTTDTCINTIACKRGISLDRVIASAAGAMEDIIVKNCGIPFIYKNQMWLPASLSHHGAYRSLVYLNPES